jgi:hypothetical protein
MEQNAIKIFTIRLTLRLRKLENFMELGTEMESGFTLTIIKKFNTNKFFILFSETVKIRWSLYHKYFFKLTNERMQFWRQEETVF